MDQLALSQEIEDALLRTERPSVRLEAMRRAGALHQVPELLTLPGVQQDPRWHPEGDVWIHTLLVVDQAVGQRPADERQARILMWAALCHDLGKPLCTVFKDGRWKSPGHDQAGVRPTRALLSRLVDDAALIESVCKLVLDHLAPHFFAEERTSRAGIRRLLRRLDGVPLDLLVRLGRADSWGRTTEQARRREYPSGEWLLEQAAGINLDEVRAPPVPPPIVLGRHLLPLGYRPGPELGRVLQSLHEAQLAGHFEDVEGGLRWLRARATALAEVSRPGRPGTGAR